MGAPKRLPSTAYGEKSENQRGKGPKPGAKNAGRRPKSLTLHLKDLRRSAEAQQALARAAADETCRGFGTAWKVLADYDEEKPAERKELKGDVKVSVVFGEE